MIQRCEVVRRICDAGLIAVVRADSDGQALEIAEACRLGGVSAIEVTFTVPGASRAIEALAAQYRSGDVLPGAGTVLDAQTARIAILAGARFVVSPCLNKDVIALCSRYGVTCIPGAMTVTEIVEAMACGAELIKAFPGEVLGPEFVSAVRGPLPRAQLVPTGGVSLENVDKWMRAGSVAVGVGTALTGGARTGDYASITAKAKQFVERIAAART